MKGAPDGRVEKQMGRASKYLLEVNPGTVKRRNTSASQTIEVKKAKPRT